jgi:hypothetical protein
MEFGSSRSVPAFAVMSTSGPYRYLPQEILDSIVDLLRDEPETLETCCLVSKSWVPCARMHLFARIVFECPAHLEAWKETFPDPTNSPAHHTRFLVVHRPEVVTVADAEEGCWIPTFSNVERLELRNEEVSAGGLNLVPFHNFLPALKSLRLVFESISLSAVFNLICSPPLLEDLDLKIGDVEISDGGSTVFRPPTSPPLTGTLTLSFRRGMDYFTRRLLDLPNGLHFRDLICTLSRGEALKWVPVLVEGCSDTLEHVRVGSFTPRELRPFGFCGCQTDSTYQNSVGPIR